MVVDDASTDDTQEFLRQVDDARVRVLLNHPATGMSGARNRGLESARGERIALCDDDDLWAPDKLSAQLAAASEGGAP